MILLSQVGGSHETAYPHDEVELMFGGKIPPSVPLDTWLGHLQDARPADRTGELVAKNLSEDPNVPDSFCQAFCGCITGASQSPNSGVEAEALFCRALDELKQQGLTFNSNANDDNKLPSIPFDRLARAIPMIFFAKYNMPDTMAIADLDDENRLAALQARIDNGDIEIADLQQAIASTCAFATDASTLESDAGVSLAPDEIRDKLGLDDSRYCRGQRMVIFEYRKEKLSPDSVYKPTVLDAGSYGAFLPSEPDGSYGMTQHLETGQKGCPEIIHHPIPASAITRLSATNPLQQDPSTGYRAVRLGR